MPGVAGASQRSRVDAVPAVVLRRHDPGRLRGNRSRPTKRPRRARQAAQRRTAGNRQDGEHVARADARTEPVRGRQMPRWARRYGVPCDGSQSHRQQTPALRRRRAPAPRCEATGAQLGLDGAARRNWRGCLAALFGRRTRRCVSSLTNVIARESGRTSMPVRSLSSAAIQQQLSGILGHPLSRVVTEVLGVVAEDHNLSAERRHHRS